MSYTTTLLKRFENVQKEIDRYNYKIRYKRLVPITQSHKHMIVEIGIYDTKTHKYALTDVRAHNANEIMKEMEDIVRRVGRDS